MTDQRSPRATRPPRVRARRATACCTIIARNYLSYARILAESYLQHHPDHKFYVLVVDGLPAGVSLPDTVQSLRGSDLALDAFWEMTFKYEVTELSTAVKPTLMKKLFNEGYERVIYLDPDILVLRQMVELEVALGTMPIQLTPHIQCPIPQDGKRPSEQDILIAGAYNLGFLALAATTEAAAFLTWWESRLRDLCRRSPAEGLMVDQRWVDLAPSLFQGTAIFRDPTYNVAYWNLHERAVQRVGDTYAVDKRPLTFFHFSGYRASQPALLSKHQTRFGLQDGSAISRLYDDYQQLQMKCGYSESSQWDYGFASFDNGAALPDLMRQLYLSLPELQRTLFGNPFSTRPGSFYDWATTSQSDTLGLSPLLAALYRSRYDLMAEFPDVEAADRDRFLTWVHDSGHEHRLDARLLKAAPVDVTAPLRWTGQIGGSDSFGINVCGYLRNESGLGGAARGYVRALERAGIAFSLKDVSDLSVNRSGTDELSDSGAHPYPVNLVVINADQHFVVAGSDPDFFAGRYNIGVWAWELPTFPEEWHDRFGYYDEIWVGSSFIQAALAPIAPIPVIRVPPVLATQPTGDRERARRALAMDDSHTVFLFMFDYHSYFERKNPLAVVEAFKKAFGPKDKVRLVIKCVNADKDTANHARLRRATKDRRISLISGYISSEEVGDLLSACDGYVSLHRSEGTGLTLAEAMAAGKPVVATDWSGNTDFMDVSDSFPVSYELADLEGDYGPYRAGNTWATPSVLDAAEKMRVIHDEPDMAARKGQRAARRIHGQYGSDGVGLLVQRRLHTVRQVIRAGGRPARPLPPPRGLDTPVDELLAQVVGSTSPGATIAVISKGDERLLGLPGREAWHFPRDESGVYAGYYPAHSDGAVAHLKALQRKGVGYLVVPQANSWWLDYYRDFHEHLFTRHRLALSTEVCTVFELVAEPLRGIDHGAGAGRG